MTLITVILDTNVIISGLLSPQGSPGEIFDCLEKGKIIVATSNILLTELERVLTYSKVRKYLNLSDEEINLFLRRFKMFTEVVQPEISINVIEKDPDDDRVLECAIAANATFIITGDQHLLELGEFQGIEILTPSVFTTWFATRNK